MDDICKPEIRGIGVTVRIRIQKIQKRLCLRNTIQSIIGVPKEDRASKVVLFTSSCDAALIDNSIIVFVLSPVSREPQHEKERMASLEQP